MLKLFSISLFFFFFLALTGCKKFIDIPLPGDQLTTDLVFSNDNTAIESVTGIYSNMMNNSQQFSCGYTSFFAGMAADELYYYSPGFRDEFINNEITSLNHANIDANFWKPCYQYIYAANKCIEGVEASTQLSADVKNQVLGEAKFIRGFCYFYLVNLFGDVPLVVSTNYKETQSLPRNSVSAIYQQIIDDLRDAESLLVPNYTDAERTRPNSYAAATLLARVYLYKGDWQNAASQSTMVLNSGTYQLNNDLNNVFQNNSMETIWQLRPVNTTRNTWEGYTILPTSNSTTPTYLLTSSLVNSFEPGDLRKSDWIKSRNFSNQVLYYPYKYKVRASSTQTEYYVILRLAEDYLIRSEARVMQDDLAGALSDLNMIRQRAGLPDSPAMTKDEIKAAIEHERRIEFLSEWGHRWFDLKRTGRTEDVLGTLKPLTWQTTDSLWPIPQQEMNLNPQLTQNPGY